MAREVTWAESAEWLPEVYHGITPIYHPDVDVSDALLDAVEELGGKELESAYGYGSSFFNSAAPDSLVDLLLLVDNPLDFYRDLLERRPQDLGVKNAEWNARVSTINPNFHRGVLETSNGPVQIKYGVAGEDDFWRFARGGRKDAHQSGKGKGYLYTAGRVQKVALVPLFSRRYYDQAETDQAINQARVDGAWLALGLLPDHFGFDQFARTYIGLSYKADLRVEKPTKVQSIYENNREDYEIMLDPILAGIASHGALEQVGDWDYHKKASLSEQSVKDWLNEAKIWSATMNYGKNPVVWGIGGGIKYAFDKVKRVVNS